MYSFDSRVRYSECDETGRLSILGLVNYLQDCSTFHSESLGLGLARMAADHYAWFISAWQIEIGELPSFGDDITVSTWCYGLRRALASRNFTINDQVGNTLVRADSLWFVFDTEACRPVRIPDSQRAYLSGEGRLDMPATRRRIPVEGPFVETSPIVVDEQQLDTNRHVNNARYISMALAALDELGISLDLHRISVQYHSMALSGDTIVPRVSSCASGRTVELSRPEGGPFATVMLQDA